MGSRIIAAVGLPLVWSSMLLPRLGLGQRGRTVVNAGFATGYAFVFGGHPNWCSARGLRCGLVGMSLVAAGYGAALAIPPLRERLSALTERAPEIPLAEWVGVHISLGTVYSEELVFRGTLDPLLDNAFGPRLGAALGAATFGLWHTQPARSAGDSVPATVAATAVSGAALGWLGRSAGSATAPALLHFAVNSGGAVAPWPAARFAAMRASRTGGPLSARIRPSTV